MFPHFYDVPGEQGTARLRHLNYTLILGCRAPLLALLTHLTKYVLEKEDFKNQGSSKEEIWLNATFAVIN